MNAKILKFMEDLEKIKSTHPNIYQIWSTYITARILTLDKSIDKGRLMLAASRNIPDIAREDILLLLAFSDA